eukprot:CAMPEP_0206271464 /NCGR_PEP_ID=MMETSP0047_2-20121206/33447_1 /ASSEMBLY_ACC=CAM_ASM_000192 /TAXON_ID=195065 /ORGANISM="Chroomonas mesostigmatica_cf, Strain CCMP1168" /LENGTH=30 /DNA_ID= /DNA_START= /DNA_END= /DNA_ORIENTATION=
MAEAQAAAQSQADSPTPPPDSVARQEAIMN